MYLETDQCLAAIAAKDRRFDGYFITGVTSTCIYCRPSCPAITPRVKNVRFYPSAAAAQQAGFRACKRCRPDAAPGSPEWNQRSDVAARAMRLIGDGEVDRIGVSGLAATLGYSTRQLQRLLTSELGAGPLALARAQRAQTARVLIETTSITFAQVAFASGFSSVRQFNDTIGAVYATTPTALRASAKAAPVSAPGVISIRLPFREPLHVVGLFGHLAATAVPGIEFWDGTSYRRTLRLPHGAGFVALTPREGFIHCELTLEDLADLTAAVGRCRRLLDLDADPEQIDVALSLDPSLAPLINAGPGRRIPGTCDAQEFAIRVVLGQQVSTAAGRTHAARLVSALGDPVVSEIPELTHLFPTCDQLAGAPDHLFAMPQRRRDSLRSLAAALARGDVDLSAGADRHVARAALGVLRGIGPWTIEQIAMRALGDPDAFVASDLGVLSSASSLGIATSVSDLRAAALRWSPWRSYAVQYLWGIGPHPINTLERTSTP